MRAIGADPRHRAAQVAECERRRCAECSGVEPLVHRHVQLLEAVAEHRVGRIEVHDLGARERRSGRVLELDVRRRDREQRRLLRTRCVAVDEAGVEARFQRNGTMEPEIEEIAPRRDHAAET